MKYSSVNQAMETVSTIAKPGFSTGLPLASFSYTDEGELLVRDSTSYWSDGKVLMVIPTIETATKRLDMMDIALAAVLVSGFSMRSHIIFWYFANFPVPKSSSSSFIALDIKKTKLVHMLCYLF